MTTVFRQFRPRMDSIPIRMDVELEGLTMPVRLIVGGWDSMIRSNETRDWARRLLANLESVYLDHAGQFLPRQTHVIADFVRQATLTRVIAHASDRLLV